MESFSIHARAPPSESTRWDEIEGSRREADVRTNSGWLMAVILLSLQGSHAYGDEPSSPSAPAPGSPRFFSRVRDRWVRRTQALTPPSNPATSPAVPTAPLQDPPGPPPLPADATRAAEPNRAAQPAQTPRIPPPAPPRPSSPTAGASPTTPSTAPGTAPPAPPPGTAAPTMPAGAGIAAATQPLPDAEALAPPARDRARSSPAWRTSGPTRRPPCWGTCLR